MLILVNNMSVAMVAFEAFSFAKWRVSSLSCFAVFFNSLNICCKNFELYRTLWLRYNTYTCIFLDIVDNNASLGFCKRGTIAPTPPPIK